MATQTQVMKVCGVMAAAYPNFELRKETIDVYVKLLADLDADELAVAAEQCVAESKFFPTIAELRERVLMLHKQIDRTPDWTQAWEEVQREIRRVGYAGKAELRFTHPNVQTAVDRVGWWDLCYTDLDNINTLRAQFRDTYNAIATRKDQGERLLPRAQAMIGQLATALDANTKRPALPQGRE